MSAEPFDLDGASGKERPSARRWTKVAGSVISTWLSLGCGYLWGRYSLLLAAEVWGGALVGLLALRGVGAMVEDKLAPTTRASREAGAQSKPETSRGGAR